MPRCVLKTVFALFVSTVLSSHAIDFTWDGAGDGISWNDPANWTANSGFPGASDTAIFNGPGTVELDTAIPNGFVETQINGGRVNLNSLANAIPSGTLVVANGATLGILTSAGLSGLGSADLTLNGGTLEFLAGGAADVDGLDETIFDLPTGDPRNDIEGYRNRATNLTAADAQGILSGHLHYNADADITIRANDLGASGFNDGDFAALWTTRFTPNEDGAWGLRFSASDDNVGLWIDVDQNGTFELTDRIYERTCCAGSGDQFTPALINGQTYLLGIVLSDTGGGGYLRDMEYKAPSGAWTDLNPSTSPGLFQVTAVAAGTLANNLSVNADSTVRMGTALPGLTLGDLTFGGSADLLVDSVDGRQGLSFSGNTLLNGSVSFTQTGKARVRVGSISELTTSGISQQGDGNLIFTTSNSYSGFTEVNAGTLELRADGGLGLDTDITIVNAGGSLVANGNFNYTVAEIIELHGAGNSDSAGAFVNIGNKDWFVPMILESDARIYNLSGNLSLFGQVDLAGNDLELFCDVNQIEIETSGGLNGAGNITAGGINGRIILYNNVNDINNFTGTLTISNIIWDARSPDALGTTDGPTIVTDGGRLELRDGRTWGDDIFISGTDFGAGAIRQENNFNTVTGTITLDADAMIYANSGTLTVAGQIVGPHTLQLAGNIGVTILTQENLMDAAEIVSGTTRIQHVGSLGGTTNLVLNSRTALELDGGLTLDQSGALQGVEFNGGRLGSFNGLNTLDFPLSLKTFGGLELGGEGDLMVTQPFGLGNDPLFDIEVDGLSHYGFHHFGDALLDLDGNGGLMKQGRPEDLQGLFGLTLLTTGPQGRGLDFNVDQDFLDAGVIGQGDSYDNLWLGYLNVPAGLAGNWEFRNAGDDDRGGIWIDLNTNGVFESSTPGFGSNRGEQLSWEDGGAKVVTLAEGSYLIAFTHHEFSGEAAVDFRFRTSFMLANGHPELIIKPSDSNQAGLWSPYAPVFPKNTLTKSGNGAVFLPVANTYNNGTKIEGGALVAFDAESLGLPGTPLTLAGGTLALSGDIAIDVGDVTIEGAGGRYWNGVLSNVDGSNTFTATSLAIEEFFTGDTGMGSTDGQLTVNAPTLDLRNSRLVFDGEGEVIFHPDVTSGALGTNQVALMQAFLFNGNATRFPGDVNQLASQYFSQEAWFPNEIDWINFWGNDIIGLNNPNPVDPNNYGNALLGDLTIDGVGTANVQFRHTAADDANHIRIDLNQDGTFEAGLEDPYGGDQGGTFTTGTVAVPRGTPIPVLLQHREGGGGSRLQPELSLDDGLTWQHFVPGIMSNATMTTSFIADGAIIKQGSGTATLTGSNTHQGLTRVRGGVLQIASPAALGTTTSGTRVESGTLALLGPMTLSGEALILGGTGAPGMPGALVNLSGSSLIDAPTTLTAPSNATVIGIGAVSGSLTILPDIALSFAALHVGGDGDTIINGAIAGLGSGTSMPAYSARVIEDDPIVYYQLNETFGSNVVNSGTSGSINDGMLFDGAHTDLDVPSQNPALGTAAAFDNDIATGITTPFSMNVLNERFTIEAWVLSPAGQDGRSGIAGQNDAYEFGMANDVSLDMWNPAGAALQAPYPIGEWFHIAVTGDGVDRRIYVNAVEVGTKADNVTDYGNSSFFFNIGGQGIQDAANNAFNGSIDEVAVYDTALNPAAIQRHYDARDAIEANNALVKTGKGTLTLNGLNTFDGGTRVSGDGVLNGNGVLSSVLVIDNQGTFSPGTSPGNFVVSADVVFTNLSAVYLAELNGPTTAGVDYDRVISAGDVRLNNATLVLTRDPGYTPTPGQMLTIATSPSPITTTFNGLPEGAPTSASGAEFTVSYLSNAVTLSSTGGLRVYAGPDLIIRPVNSGVSVPLSALLANDLMGDGPGPLMITGVSPNSVEGGIVTLNAGMLTYTPTNGYEGLDSFTYTVTDGADSALGLVSVGVTLPTNGIAATGDLSRLQHLPNGDYRIAFSGTPGAQYAIEWTQDLIAPTVWQNLGVVTAGAAGEILLDHANPPDGVNYYRAALQ